MQLVFNKPEFKEVMATRSTAQVNAFASIIRLFESWGQCADGAWIAANFPNMLHLRDFGNFASHSVFDHNGEDDYIWTYAEDTWYSDNVVDYGAIGYESAPYSGQSRPNRDGG